MMQIKYINYGIGYFYTNKGKSWIELHQALKKYPKLHEEVLQHELGHAKLKGKYIDFMHEIKQLFNLKHQLRLMLFSLRHPSALISSTPIFFTKQGLAVNWFALLYLALFMIIGLGVFIL